MNKVLLIIITISMMVVSGIFLGKFYLTQLANSADYYFLILCLAFTIVGVVTWWLTFKRS
jgi:hypothetical protein